MSSSDDDGQQRFALGFLLVLITLLLSVVVGAVVVNTLRGTDAAPAVSAATAVPEVAPPAEVAADAPSVRVDNGVVKFYFASGKAELAQGANDALADVVKGVADGKTAVVSGFHDATGDAAVNAELAKQRAFAVRDALKSAGVADDRIDLRKPEETMAGGDNAEARRVEVALQ